ncbi:hypothetical protein ACFE04_031449 [Oxalis oulophora]
MRISMMICKQATPLLDMPSGRVNIGNLSPRWQKEREKVVIVLGATGTGKSRLSIDLATKFHSEIINSDKIQVHQGLDIVTNKMSEREMCGVPHHLLGILDPNVNLTAPLFCDMAMQAVESIHSSGQLPIIVGGSNSFVEALVDDDDCRFRSKYDCCFLWVDVSVPILHQFVSERVNRMVEKGMIDEVRRFFDSRADYTKGVRKAIGVPELDRYLRVENLVDQENREKLLQKAVQEIKENTIKLVSRQLDKIHRLRNVKKWKLHRLDATEAFSKQGKEADFAWEKLVAGPSKAIVSEFLYNVPTTDITPFTTIRDQILHCLVA